MDRRLFLKTLSALAASGVGGCSSGFEAPHAAKHAAQWSAIFIPGYTPKGVVPQNEPADSRKRRNRAQQGTLLTRIAPDGSLRQAAFPLIGHDVAISPDGRTGFFGRMGNDGSSNTAHHIAFDPETLEMIAVGAAPKPDWRGGGHRVFLPDGTLLTAERAPMRAYAGKPSAHYGRIALRDPLTLVQKGSFSCHGIDPHELRLLPDGRHIAVANYGSVAAKGSTQLAEPRRVIEPSVTVIHIASGALVRKFASDTPEMELRHIALGAAGQVFAIRARLAAAGADAQLQRLLGETRPDITAEGTAAFMPAPPMLFDPLQTAGLVLAAAEPESHLRHGLSVEYDPVQDEFLATFPSSHRLMVFDAGTGQLRKSIDTRRFGLRYPCGLTLLPGQDFYAVAGHWQNLAILQRGTHRLERALAQQPLLYGHSHMTAA